MIPLKVVFDSHAWIEIFRGSSAGRKALDILEESEAVFTPEVILAEISKKYSEEGYKEREIKERIESVMILSRILRIDEDLCLMIPKAHSYIFRHGSFPNTIDCILLASAWKIDGKILTGRNNLKKLPEAIWLWERSKTLREKS